MMSSFELFVSVYDFCQVFPPFWERKLISQNEHTRHRKPINGLINIIDGLIA